MVSLGSTKTDANTNLAFHNKAKHVEIKYHMVQRNAIQLRYNTTDEQSVDALTKPLAKLKFVHFRDKLGVVESEALAKRKSQHPVIP